MNKHRYTLHIVSRFNTINEMIKLACAEAGSKTAFSYKSGGSAVNVSYKKFTDDTYAFRHALAAYGIKDGAHAACCGESRYEWATAYLGVLCSDCVFVPVDRELPPQDMVNVLVHSDSSVLFCSDAVEKIVSENLDKLDGIKYFICFDRDKISEDGRFIPYKNFITEGRRLLDEADGKAPELHRDPYGLGMLVYTSGTTGMPKGVMLSEHGIVCCVYYGLQLCEAKGKCLSVLPWHHTYEAVGILAAIHSHVTICINDKLRNVMKNIQFFKPTYMYLVPAFAEVFYKKIWQTAEKSGSAETLRRAVKRSNSLRKAGIDMRRVIFRKIHLQFGGNLRKIVCGGAPMRPEIGVFFDSIGIKPVNGYGITECSPLVSVSHDNFNDWTTAGVPLACERVTIDDPDGDGNGEICVRGDTVMLGYYKDPEQTAQVLEDGMFRTGDYGNINKNGQITVTGRKKNLIVLDNGKNIYPEEIEGYILTVPYVLEAVVSGIKDESGSEIALCAEVYLDRELLAGSGESDPIETLRNDIKVVLSPLPSYKRIAKIILRDTEFEKTTSKKIKRNYAQN